ETRIAVPAFSVAGPENRSEHRRSGKIHGQCQGAARPARFSRCRTARAERVGTAVAIATADAIRHAADGPTRPVWQYAGHPVFPRGTVPAVRKFDAASRHAAVS